MAGLLNEKDAPGVLVSVSDYVKLGADGLNGHLSRKLWTLGTDGFGRSEARTELRDFFEVDAKHVVLATLYALQREGKVKGEVVAQAWQISALTRSGKRPYCAECQRQRAKDQMKLFVPGSLPHCLRFRPLDTQEESSHD
ncbi:hypothetical protein [Deinococcus radiophilus]|uniref:hypothetical protein n=1 Tax=Deinococcus radiophilus TaxID=32062 RepID=UPI003615F3F8